MSGGPSCLTLERANMTCSLATWLRRWSAHRRHDRSAKSPRYGCAFASLLACSRSEEHTSELQSLMRISYAVFCLKKKILIAQYITLYHYTLDKQETE